MLHDYWYMICPANEIKAGEIKSIQLLGQYIVLFRTAANEIIALEDRCCHRNVRLSLGFLKNDRIVCGYHGWEYDAGGICRCIPSQPADAKIPPTMKIKSYAVKIFNRWLWIFMGEPEKSAGTLPPDIPELQHWPYIYQSYDFHAELMITAESLIDPYHIAFAHRNTIGSLIGQIDQNDSDFNLEQLPDGLLGHYRRRNVGTFYQKMYFGRDSYFKTDYRFFFPNLSFIKANFNKRKLLIVEHVVPIDEQRVRMIQITLWENIFKHIPPFARWFMRQTSDKIVKEDIALLESHREYQSHRDISVKGDQISLAFRKFWRQKINKIGYKHDHKQSL